MQSTIAQIDADGIIDGYAVISHEYDAKSRPVCNVVEYPDGGVLTEVLTYNFPGEVVSSTSTYSKNGQTDTFTTTSGYDVRGRLISGTSALASGNNTPVSVSTQYHFDEFGRSSGSTTTSGSIVRSSVDTYTIQGWMNNHSVALNGSPLFAETLGYDSGNSPSYTGLITSKQESRSGVADTHHDEYQYDYAGRLSREESVNAVSTTGTAFSYDPRGNLLQAQEIGSGMMRTWSYLYSGDMLSSETISTRRPIQTNGFTHDNLGRMTSDGHSGTQMEYNHMDLLTKVASGDSILVNYSYLADGTKTSSLKASGEGLVYRGPFTYRRSTDGTLALESVVCPEGRLTLEKALLYVTDHLGSVRAVIDGCTGEVLEASQYSAYGTRSGDSTTYRDHFTGQEDQMPDFGIPYSDHGARQYSPALRRWMTPDPLSEKYYGLSPYNYCGGNPVNAVDLDGAAWFYNQQTGSFVKHIDDADDTIYLLTVAQCDAAKKGDFDFDAAESRLLPLAKSSVNSDVQLTIAQTLFNYANSDINKQGERYVALSISLKPCKFSDPGKYADTKPVSKSGILTRFILDVDMSKIVEGYQAILIFAHEIGHMLTRINTGKELSNNDYNEVIADKFAMNHWAFKKASISAQNIIRQHYDFYSPLNLHISNNFSNVLPDNRVH